MALRAGAIRFNTDSSQMEIYDGNQWTGVLGTSGVLETGGTRGVFHGGGDPADPPNDIPLVLLLTPVLPNLEDVRLPNSVVEPTLGILLNLI